VQRPSVHQHCTNFSAWQDKKNSIGVTIRSITLCCHAWLRSHYAFKVLWFADCH
jgi:hypothetical protein